MTNEQANAGDVLEQTLRSVARDKTNASATERMRAALALDHLLGELDRDARIMRSEMVAIINGPAK